MAREHHPLKPFYSVLVLAFFCSALVAGAAVGLRPLQEANRSFDQKKNILYAAGLYRRGTSVEKMFEQVETRLVDLESGTFIPADQLNALSFNQRKASLDPKTSSVLKTRNDPAGIGRRENIAKVYLVRQNDTLDQIILPVRGKGLWSTMHGYIALAGDLSTIRGISFYEHGETPGLGGEIENKRWQESWRGKRMYDAEGNRQLILVKGSAPKQGGQAAFKVDGLSGATLTANGVNRLLEFWFGDHGFKPFLENIRTGGLDV